MKFGSVRRHTIVAAVLLVLFLLFASGYTYWTVSEEPRHAIVRSRESSISENSAPATNRDGQQRRHPVKNSEGAEERSSNQRATVETEPGILPGRLTQPSDEAESTPLWNPTDFDNIVLAWRLPMATDDAMRPDPQSKYPGTPTFIRDADVFRTVPDAYGRDPLDFFNPMKPDGMLVITPNVFSDYSDHAAWFHGATIEVVAGDGAVVYSYPLAKKNRQSIGIPYSYQHPTTIGLSIKGPGILPLEAVIGQFSCVKTLGGPNSPRFQILIRGEVKPQLQVFPSDYSDIRQIKVQTAQGQPVVNAILTTNGVQVLGCSDTTGVLHHPWPRPYISGKSDGNKDIVTQAEFLFVSAPGFVPVLLERSTLENATSAVEVTLKARELLVSISEIVPHPEVLRLGANESRESSILNASVDLLPVPDDWEAIDDWSDVIRTFWFGCSKQEFIDLVAKGTAHTNSFVPPHGSSPPSWGDTNLRPYTPRHKIGGESARKLAEALGRQPTEHWPEYAHWYYGRWDYDEREGRFDVVLPFPGRFLLAVGEFNHGVKGDERNGGLTHALYIDARNPAQLRSKLLIHPEG